MLNLLLLTMYLLQDSMKGQMMIRLLSTKAQLKLYFLKELERVSKLNYQLKFVQRILRMSKSHLVH